MSISPLLLGGGGAVAVSNVSSAVLISAGNSSKNSARLDGGALAVTNSSAATITLLSSIFNANTVWRLRRLCRMHQVDSYINCPGQGSTRTLYSFVARRRNAPSFIYPFTLFRHYEL